MTNAPLPPETDEQREWFKAGQAADAEGWTVVVQPDDWSDDQWYWYERGVIERSRLYADSLERNA
jgi:hypothetical protein